VMTATADHSAFLNPTQTKDRTMTPLFRTGQLIAHSDFLSLIPRSAMIPAIVRHVTNPRPIHNGEPIRSEHQHDGIGFHLLTMEDRTNTLLRLDEASIRLACVAGFDGMPFTTVAQTLSRLDRKGVIQRMGKGLYDRLRQTTFGPNRPNMSRIRSLVRDHKGAFVRSTVMIPAEHCPAQRPRAARATPNPADRRAFDGPRPAAFAVSASTHRNALMLISSEQQNRQAEDDSNVDLRIEPEALILLGVATSEPGPFFPRQRVSQISDLM
jgi:hypothetical protein